MPATEYGSGSPFNRGTLNFHWSAASSAAWRSTAGPVPQACTTSPFWSIKTRTLTCPCNRFCLASAGYSGSNRLTIPPRQSQSDETRTRRNGEKSHVFGRLRLPNWLETGFSRSVSCATAGLEFANTRWREGVWERRTTQNRYDGPQ